MLYQLDRSKFKNMQRNPDGIVTRIGPFASRLSDWRTTFFCVLLSGNFTLSLKRGEPGCQEQNCLPWTSLQAPVD